MKPEEIVSFRRDYTTSIGRAALAHVLSRVKKSKSAIEHATEMWPHDKDVQFVLRAATMPTDTTGAAALAQISLAVFPMLVPYSGAAQLFERGLSVTLGRSAGVMVPGIRPLSGTVQFVAEGGPKPVIQGISSGPLLGPNKIAGIAVVTAELYSLDASDTLIRALLSESSGPALDAVVFSSLAASAAHPAGILVAGAPVTPATGVDAFVTDIKALATAVAPVSGAGGIAFIASPGQVESVRHRMGAIADTRWIASSAVPLGTVIAVAVNAIVSSMGIPEFETSTQATVQMDDAPTTLMAGAATRSLFQTASVGIKMLLPVTWGVRASNAVAYAQNVNW